MAIRFRFHSPRSLFGRTRKAAGRVLSAVLLFLFFCPLTALALDHFIGEPPEIYFKNNTLHLHLRLSVDDEDGLRLLLRDGAILDLNLNLTVERKRTLWKNERIAALEFHSLLKFDPLTRRYLMTNPLTHETIQSDNLRSLLANSWKNMDFPLLGAEKFISGENYLVIVSPALQYTELPPWLDRSLVFWSRDIVPSETYTLEFIFDYAALSR